MLDRPIRSISPFSLSSTEGTADKGARSDTVDCERPSPGLEDWTRGGEDDKIPVLDVGMGVGYLRNALDSMNLSRFCLLAGRGNPGEDESGSNGGSKEGAGRFIPAMLDEEEESTAEAGGSVGSSAVATPILFTGDEVMMKGQEAWQRKEHCI